MAYNSDGYIMIDFAEVDFRRTNQTIEGLYKRCVDVIGTNKFILVINANGRTPLPATCSFTNNQYVIDSVIYMFAVTSNDNLFIRRNDVPASDIIDDSSISVDKTWSSLNTVEQLAPIDTIVNNPAVFNTSLALPLVECSTSFEATQEGTGDPSPTNVRPIHGFSEVNVTANNVVYTIQLGQEVYGAEVDAVNGVAHCTSVKQIYNGTQLIKLANWRPTTTSVGLAFDPTTYIGTRPTSTTVEHNILCNKLKMVSYNAIYIGAIDSEISISTDPNYGLFMRLPDPSLTTSAVINQYLSENPIEVVYELAEPFDIQLTPAQIETIQGNNTIFADTGAIKVSYRHLPIDLI